MEDYGSDVEDCEGWDDEDELEDPILENQVSENTLSKIKDFKVHTTEQIIKKQQKLIENIIELLGIDEDDAITSLKHFEWNSERLEEKWFEDTEKTKKEGGLVPDNTNCPPPAKKYADLCQIGFLPLVKDKINSLKGGHIFCRTCWEDFMENKLLQGYEGVFAKCPQYGCPLNVTHSIWQKVLSGTKYNRYLKFHCKSFTDETKNIKWCPKAGGTNCIENLSYVVTEVECDGGNFFCFKCGEDSHRPCSCTLALKWMSKNKSESENITWMIANTKNCPKCQRPIEKNQGCNHMTCQLCKYEFCWMCMGDWKDHGNATGGYYKCNKYEELKSTPNDLTKQEEKRERAQHELKKYMFFFERYRNHVKAGDHAIEMRPKIDILLEKLNTEKSYPIAELLFLREGLDEVIRGRKVLKWTYAYGFYLEDEKEKALFENAQELLEKNADRLHEYLEQDFEPYLGEEQLDKKPFYQYKSNLVNGYKVTKQFYTNLLDGLEKGLTK